MAKKLLTIILLIMAVMLVASCQEAKEDEFFVVTFRGPYVTKTEVSVKSGDKVNKPADPTRDGYRFLYWETEGGEKYDFDTPISGDIVLYANWDRIKPPKAEFLVRFYGVDGLLISEQRVLYGESAKEPVVSASDFFVLDGWDRSFNRVYEDMDIHIRQRYVGSSADLFTYEQNDDKTYTLTGVKPEADKLRASDGTLKLGLPSRYSGGAITAIKDGTQFGGALSGLKLTSVYIPSNYRRIGSYAFYNNPELREVTFSEGLVSIGDGAFMATIDRSVAPEGDFMGLSSGAYVSALTTVKLPASLETIGAYAFNHIGGRLDGGVYSMRNVTLTVPSGSKLRQIGDYAFEGAMLGEINLSGATEALRIGKYAFAADTQLNWLLSGEKNLPTSRVSKLYLPKNVVYIGDYAFYEIGTRYSYSSSGVSLTDTAVEFRGYPMNVEYLGDYAFYGAGLTGDLVITCSRLGYMSFYGHKLGRITVTGEVIGPYAFAQSDGQSVDSILTLNNVTEIDMGAFMDNLGLSSVSLPSTLTEIDESAFKGCRALSGRLVLPASLSRIDDYAFNGSGVEEVEIGGKVALGRECFANSSLRSLVGTITGVGTATFKDCASLTSLNLPDNLVSLPEQIFSGCASLSTIELPSTLSYIGAEAFKDCVSLKAVQIPEEVTYIRSSAFENCSSLASVEFLGEQLTTVEASAFALCRALTAITLPNSVSYVGDYAFRGTAITEFITPASLKTLGFRAFAREEYSIKHTSGTSGTIVTTKVQLPQLNRFVISKDTGLIEFDPRGSFDGSSIARFEVEDENDYYSEVGGFLCSQDGKKLIRHIGDAANINVVVPEGIEEIGERAFLGNKYMQSVSLPSSLRRIDDYAFSCSTTLKAVTIPASVEYLGKYAFAGNENEYMELNKLSFASGCALTEIGEYAFAYNRGLTSLAFSGNINKIGDGAFLNATALNTVDFSGANLTSTGVMTFSGCTSLKNITFGELTDIGYGSFSDCSSLAKVTLGSKIETISSRALRNCVGLKEIVIPADNALKTISSYAFAGSNSRKMTLSALDLSRAKGLSKIDGSAFAYGSLTSVVLPSCAFTLGDNAFAFNEKLSSVELGGVTEIGEDVLRYCTSLSSLVLPSTVKVIAKNAFRSLELTSVQIGSEDSGVTGLVIGQNAFFDCKKLTLVDIYGDVPALEDLDDNLSFSYLSENNVIRVNSSLKIRVDRGRKNRYLSGSFNGWSVYSQNIVERN